MKQEEKKRELLIEQLKADNKAKVLKIAPYLTFQRIDEPIDLPPIKEETIKKQVEKAKRIFPFFSKFFTINVIFLKMLFLFL
jgi:hypothetical protein